MKGARAAAGAAAAAAPCAVIALALAAPPAVAAGPKAMAGGLEHLAIARVDVLFRRHAALVTTDLTFTRGASYRGGTDARAIQLTRAGVPAGCISIPVRYVHSPSEMVDFSDVQNAIRLLTAVLRTPIDLSA